VGNESAYRILVAKVRKKLSLARVSCIWKDNIKKALEIRYECVDSVEVRI
jgi:hypothetical protein